MNEQNLKKKLNIMIVTVILLICGLTVTSFALVSTIVKIQNNRFSMSLGVDLSFNNDNDDQPVVDMSDILFEPGGTYRSEFPIVNNSTFDVWYRVYLTNVEGALKDDITVTIKDEDGNELCKGPMDELGPDKVKLSTLKANQTKTLTIDFYFSPDADNTVQGQTVSFNITADATQMEHNSGPNVDFGDLGGTK